MIILTGRRGESLPVVGVLHLQVGGDSLPLLYPPGPPPLAGVGAVVLGAGFAGAGVLRAGVLGAGVLGADVYGAGVLGGGGCGVVVCGGKDGEITHRSMAGSGVHPLHDGGPLGAPCVLADVAVNPGFDPCVDLPVVEAQELDGEVGLALGHLLPASWVLAYHWSHG